jgi:outer membrane protein OmpA-like peptidoglycan-associated protein
VDTTIDESLMSKRESPISLVLVLAATFGLSAGGIWWAHQFGFAHSSVESQLQTTTNSSDSTVPEANNTQTPVSTLSVVSNSKSTKNADSPTQIPPTPEVPTKRAKTGDDLENFPVKGWVKFVTDSAQVTNEGEQVLERLVQDIKNFTTQGIAVKIAVYGEPESSKTLGQQRGENIAGYLRDRGLGHRIFISHQNSKENGKQNQNAVLEVSLVKR